MEQVTLAVSSPSAHTNAGRIMKKIAFSMCLIMATLVILSVPLLAHAPPNTPPTIGTPVIQPSSPTYNAPATVSVNVTDQHSSVQHVTIIYTTDNCKSLAQLSSPRT